MNANRKGMEFSALAWFIISLLVLVLLIMFLTNIGDLRDTFLSKLDSLLSFLG